MTASPETLARVRQLVASQFGLEPDDVSEHADFDDDIGADSLDIIEVEMLLEAEFDIEIPDTVHYGTVAELAAIVQQKVQDK